MRAFAMAKGRGSTSDLSGRGSSVLAERKRAPAVERRAGRAVVARAAGESEGVPAFGWGRRADRAAKCRRPVV